MLLYVLLVIRLLIIVCLFLSALHHKILWGVMVPRSPLPCCLTDTLFSAISFSPTMSTNAKIENTMEDLEWKPQFSMKEALRNIFDSYRTQVAEARSLVE